MKKTHIRHEGMTNSFCGRKPPFHTPTADEAIDFCQRCRRASEKRAGPLDVKLVDGTWRIVDAGC